MIVKNGKLILIATLLSTAAFAQPEDSVLQTFAEPRPVCGGYFPNSTMRIPVGTSKNFGIDRARYDKVLDRIETIFGPRIRALGGQLVVERSWNSDEVNASAMRWGNQYIINMYGGLARHPLITEEGFTMVACHEVGHHLGGAPKTMGWATNEGGSDYYSSLKCMRWFYEGADNEAWAKSVSHDTVAVNQCKAQYPDREDYLICLRSAAGALSIAACFADVDKVANTFRFDTPDPAIVTRTNNGHPDTQCRLDTLFAGAICKAPLSTPVSGSDPKAGSCVQGTDLLGWRPLCWFKP